MFMLFYAVLLRRGRREKCLFLAGEMLVVPSRGELLALDNLSLKLGTPMTMHTSSLTFLFSSFSPFPFP